MADNIEMIRPINLPEAQQLSENDVFILDSTTGGVRKIPKNKVYTPVDDTLSESGEAADAKVTGEKIDELKAETALIQNPVGNKSGELVSFSDGADMPAISVIAHIEPIQEGEGDPSPSNVRPISGWGSANLRKSGKNLINIADGATENTQANIGFVVVPAGVYTASAFLKRNDGGACRIYMTVGDNAPEGGSTVTGSSGGVSTYTFATTEPTTVRFGVQFLASYDTMHYSQIQVELGTTATAYEPYQGQTITKDLGRTVYGGEAEIVGGSLTDKMGIVDLGSLSWAFITPTNTFPYGYFYANISGKKVGETNIIADSYKTYASMQGDIDNGIMGSASNNRIFIVNSAYSDANAFKTAMSGKYVCYELATPQTYTLTAEEIRTLRGDNNVWCDSGIVDVTYRKDINIVIDELTNAIVSLGSNV